MGLYRSLDANIETAARGLELPCKSGCDACCHESVFLSAPEFFAVAAHLMKTRTRAQLESLLMRMSKIAGDFEDELELLEYIPAGEERDEVAERVKFRCPLLGEDGRCTVYEVRELNARTFGQCWDQMRNSAYGCELTHARLMVLPEDGPKLFDAREARRRLVEQLPNTARVHVYPWWFKRYGALILD